MAEHRPPHPAVGHDAGGSTQYWGEAKAFWSWCYKYITPTGPGRGAGARPPWRIPAGLRTDGTGRCFLDGIGYRHFAPTGHPEGTKGGAGIYSKRRRTARR